MSLPETAAPASTPGKAPALIALAALIGLPLAQLVMADTRSDEGVEHVAYRDLGGVWSICSGTTRGVKAGDRATDEQCDAKTAADLLVSARAVLGCVPGLKATERHEQLRAAIRFNNNTGKFCSSTGARLMKQGQYRRGCDALLAWNGIVADNPIRGAVSVRRLKSGRYFSVIRGLVNRRAAEHAICVRGLPSVPIVKASTSAPAPASPTDYPVCITVKPGPLLPHRKPVLYPRNSELA